MAETAGVGSGATTRRFWRALATAAVLGVVSGLAALVFVQLVSWGTGAVWGEPDRLDIGSGPIWWVGVGASAGLAVGLLRRALQVPDALEGPISILSTGRVDHRTAPAAVLVSLVSLVGGASLGPFDAGTRAGAALGSWWGGRRGADEQEHQLWTLNGAAGGLGGLLTAPVIATILVTELHRRRFTDYLAYVVPNLAAAVAGFAVFYVTVGSTFLGIYRQEPYDVRIWHFGAAVALGFVAAGASWLLEHTIAGVARYSTLWIASLPVRCAIGGASVGVVAVVLPATFGSGKQQLAMLADEPALGAGLLVAVALGKIVAVAASLGTGFIGGPVMPTLFIGGTLGLATSAAFPSIPPALSFSSCIRHTTRMVQSPNFSPVQ